MPKNKRPRKKRSVSKAAGPAADKPDAGRPTAPKSYGVPKSPRSSISPIMSRHSPRGR